MLSMQTLQRGLGEVRMELNLVHSGYDGRLGQQAADVLRHEVAHANRADMIANDLDAASAGHRVGYEDPSHFTREYKRLFGEPPLRDMQRVRAAATPAADL